MSIVEPESSAGSNLIERAKNILLNPSPTWDAIEAEPATIRGLYTSYAIPLAAIPAVCTILGQIVFGFGAFGISIRPSPIYVIVSQLLAYAFGLIWLYVFALIVDGLAPNFGGERNRLQAFKLGTYALTAAWVSGVFALYPRLSAIMLLGGLYSLYLCWLGLPKLMKTPQDRAGPYFAVIIVVSLVVGIVLGAVYSAVALPLQTAFGGNPLTSAHVSGKVRTPAGSIDVGELQAAAKQLEAAKDVDATDPDSLQAYLPASVAGFERTEISSSTAGAAGVEGSTAEGRYSKGDSRLELSVTDMGGAGALMAMAGSFKSSKETASGYEKMGKVNGRMTQEEYDRVSKHGEYSVVIGERFMVHAEGDGVSMDELKAAVDAVPATQLEGLAKAG